MLLCVAAVLAVSSCVSPKKFVYLQDMEPGQTYPVTIKHEAVIQRDDRLSITVSCKSPELAIPFNINSGNFRVSTDGTVSEVPAASREKGYRVDVDGFIEFPILGRLYVEGLTVTEAIDMIKTRIEEGNYIKNPIVSIEFINFKYTVIGAVAGNGTYSIDGDRITLFEAIARAGGLTEKAKVDKIAVIRESGGDRQMYIADLRTKDVFNSPCYYLQQNDIVYVEPRYLKKDAEDRGWQIWSTILSVVTTVSSVIWAVTALAN